MAGKAEYKNKWQAEKLDRINLTVPKGKKDIIKAHADKHDKGSVTAFINRAIDETMERDNNKEGKEYMGDANGGSNFKGYKFIFTENNILYGLYAQQPARSGGSIREHGSYNKYAVPSMAYLESLAKNEDANKGNVKEGKKCRRVEISFGLQREEDNDSNDDFVISQHVFNVKIVYSTEGEGIDYFAIVDDEPLQVGKLAAFLEQRAGGSDNV